MTSKLTKPMPYDETNDDHLELNKNCEFKCPGNVSLCIPARLVCNGVQNCPNVTNVFGKFF